MMQTTSDAPPCDNCTFSRKCWEHLSPKKRNRMDEEHVTELHYLCANFKFSKIIKFIEEYSWFDMNCQTTLGLTPLMIFVQTLLDADDSLMDEGLKVMNKMLMSGASCRIQDNEGESVYSIAKKKNKNKRIVELLDKHERRQKVRRQLFIKPQTA